MKLADPVKHLSFFLDTHSVHISATHGKTQRWYNSCRNRVRGIMFAEYIPTRLHASAAITFQNSIEINSLTMRAIKRSAHYKVRIPADTPTCFFQQCQQSCKQTKLKPNDIKRKILNFHAPIMGPLIWLMKQLLVQYSINSSTACCTVSYM